MCFNCVFLQIVGLYVCDMFIGFILQIDLQGNSFIVICDCIVGFGGVLNMGLDVCGWCYVSDVWIKVG